MGVFNPTITVLMTVYNGGNYLFASIQSILNQTFRDFELLIVDDASTDDSLKIIQSYGDPRIVIHSNAVNLGQTKSLNVGLKLARGKYIARMDADDLAFPQWLEELTAFLERNSNVAVVSAKAAVITDQRIVRVLNTPTDWPDILLKSLTFSSINHVGSLMRKHIALEMGGYDEQYHIPADFHFWSRLIRQGHRLAVVPRILVAIRFHAENLSRSAAWTRNQEEMISIICDNVRHLTTYRIEGKEATLLYKLIYEVHSLDYQEFQQALCILKGVYYQVKSSLEVESFIKKSLVDQEKIVYMKRILTCIDKGGFEEIRLLSRDYIRQHGWHNVFLLVWLISFGGTILPRFLPRIYEQARWLGAQWKLRCATIPKGMHG